MSPANTDAPGDAPAADAPASPAAALESRDVEIPADALILVPVRDAVLFPGLVLPITLGRKRSIDAVPVAVRREFSVGLVLQ